jgi:hypothetical protein
MTMYIDNKIIRDMVIIELEKYKKLLTELGQEGYEKVDELICILEEENNDNNEDNRERVKDS